MSKYELTDEDRANLTDRELVVSVSGGKDSTAVVLWLRDCGVTDYTPVFMDTGWEHPSTIRYVHDDLSKLTPRPVLTLKPERPMADLIRHKGMFPGRLARFCTTKLKVDPFERWVESRFGDGEVVASAVGIRAGESAARSKLPRWSCEAGRNWITHVWRPLIEWSEQDVIEIHQRHGIRPNPLYLRYGVSRVGCWPCIYARKAEIAAVAKNDPGRIDLIRQLEADLQESARKRYEARGETFESLGYTPPTFFSRRANGEDKHTHTPIDYVVEWAQTARGGKQLLLDVAEPGCVRWGMCDTGADE